MNHSATNQQGLSRLGVLVIVAAVIVLGSIAWWIFVRSSAPEQTSKDAAQNAACGSSDQDLCKFLDNWQAERPYEMTITTTRAGQQTKTILEAESPDKVHAQTTNDTTYEIILINNTLYTKAADGSWWKQELPSGDAAKYTTEQPDFANPGQNSAAYKRLGTEACGQNTCLKYEVTGSSAPNGARQYLWFDAKTHQIQRLQTIASDRTTDATFQHKAVKVSAPTNTKALPPGQSLAPGQTQPTTLPNTGDALTEEELRELMSEYQN